MKRGDFQYIPILSLRATGRKDVLLRHGRMHWTDARLHLFFLDIYLARWHGGVDLQKKWWCSHHKVKWVKCPILGIISSKTISDVYFCWFVRQRLPDKFPLLLTAPLSKDGFGAQGMHRLAVCDLLTHTHAHVYNTVYRCARLYTCIYQGSDKGGGVVQMVLVDTERNAQGAQLQNASACTFFSATKWRT